MNADQMSYKDIREDSKAFNETNDCTVIAVSVACGIPYAKAHALLALAGRKPRKGLNSRFYHPVIRQQGFKIQSIYRNRAMAGHPIRQVKAKTVRTIERELAENWGGVKVLINVPRHVLAWNGYEIVDWTSGRLHRITDVFVVYPDNEPMPNHGKSVPVPERRPLNRGEAHRQRHGCSVYIDDNLIGTYTSVKKAYEANYWDLRGHQKVRRIMKVHGEAYAYIHGGMAKFVKEG